jgi:heme-degrading monooxygenase HmoA
MFIQTSRWTVPENGGKEIYDKSKPLWQGQPGFHSMSLFDIVDGEHKGQRMVVIRFNDEASLDAAREKLTSEREQMLKDCEAAGLKMEELLRLEEVP